MTSTNTSFASDWADVKKEGDANTDPISPFCFGLISC